MTVVDTIENVATIAPVEAIAPKQVAPAKNLTDAPTTTDAEKTEEPPNVTDAVDTTTAPEGHAPEPESKDTTGDAAKVTEDSGTVGEEKVVEATAKLEEVASPMLGDEAKDETAKIEVRY